MIKPGKIDCARDFKGAFLAHNYASAYDAVKNQLQEHITQIFSDEKSNFISSSPLGNLTVHRGNNLLDSCLQYEVRDDEGIHILTVKMYDKLLDMVCRDNIRTVGSRISTILGSKKFLDKFDKRVYEAELFGMTRLEVSICHGALLKYNPLHASTKTVWEKKIRAMLDALTDKVLNSENVKSEMYRKLNLPNLLGLLGRCNNNILAIGKDNSWLINARTSHA